MQRQIPARKARDTKARGKCEAKRSTSPLVDKLKGAVSPEKGGILFRPFRPHSCFGMSNQGRRAPLRVALAPDFYIPRLWRWSTFIYASLAL